jgi:hypothetical protein
LAFSFCARTFRPFIIFAMAQTPGSDLPFSAVFVALDVCKNCVDIDQFSEYLKTANRKEIVFLNPFECMDAGRLAPKASEQEVVSFIAHAFSARAEQEVTRAIDARKKLIATIEKHRLALANATLRGRHIRGEPTELEPPRFDGKCDLLFILLDFPFFPSQIAALEEANISIAAFLAFVPGDLPLNPHKAEQSSEAAVLAPRPGKKKPAPVIPGSCLSSRLNPDCYPPPRWDGLRPIASTSLPFREVVVSSDYAATFLALEREMIKILRGKDYFQRFSESREFINLPACPATDADTSIFAATTISSSMDSVNGLYRQLAVSEFSARPALPPKSESDMCADAFSDFSREAQRAAVLDPEYLGPEPEFTLPVSPAVRGLLRELIAFTPKQENAIAVDTTIKFVSALQNFYAYAGNRFDQLFTQLNKKYGLGLPTAFFDWQSWNFGIETSTNASRVIAAALDSAAVFDSIFDPVIGVLFLMTMRPIPKVTGTSLCSRVVLQTLEGISD